LLASLTDDSLDDSGTVEGMNCNSVKQRAGVRQLQVIAVPYKEGSHMASKWTDFIPIIRQLQTLHNVGYVHGDIRGFNVVFAGNDGGLIDFDFSGKPEHKKTYPPGYRDSLCDGSRIGSGDAKSRHHRLEFWHDWYALGRLIFRIHHVNPPLIEGTVLFNRWFGMRVKWENITTMPSFENIDALIKLLKCLDEAGFSVQPCLKFRQDYHNT
jgi:hypothetical protein